MKRLRDLPAPDEVEARRRTWRLAEAAFEERRSEPAAPERRRLAGLPRAALVAAGVAALLAVAVTPPGSAVADWLGDAVRFVVDEDRPPARASGVEELPGGGRVLVAAIPRDGGATEAWIAGGGERRRLVAGAHEVTWSPHARFVAAAAGQELFAVDLEGRRRWTLPTSAPVETVEWSPDGFRVAYVARDELRVVAGDGTGDRRVAGPTPAESRTRSSPRFWSLAWRPHATAHVLAFVKRDSLFLADLDQRRVLWRVTARDHPTLAFSPGGERLLLAGGDGIRILRTRDGRTLARLPGRGRMLLGGATWDRTGHRFAVVHETARRNELLLGRRDGDRIRLRRLFTGESLDLVGFSPDNRWLLVDWAESGSWLFLPVAGGRPRQLANVAGRFDAGEVRALGWCCPP